jgi:hypothetical protein
MIHSRHKIRRNILLVNMVTVNWKLVYFFAALFSLALLVFYIIMINDLTRGAYLIKNYNKQTVALSTENKTLQNQFAESGFLGGVLQEARALNFQKTSKVTYVQILKNSLAEAK